MVGTSLGGEEEGLEGFTEWLCSNLPVYDIPLGTRAVSVSARVSGKVHREFWKAVWTQAWANEFFYPQTSN